MSAPQSVRDAIADAETLRLYVMAHPDAQPARTEILTARHHARGCNHPLFGRLGQPPEVVQACMVLSARAAFRAVPGLREARP